MPRHDVKAYTSVIARIPQELADAVKRYASVHRCTVSELIRDGLEMRLEAGEVPGRSTGSSTDHGEEVLHEVLQVLPEVLQRLSPLLLAQIQDTIRTTVTEVFHGMTSLPPSLVGHRNTEGDVPTLAHAVPEVSYEVFPMVPTLTPAPQLTEGHTTVIPMVPTIIQPATEVLPGHTSTPQPHAPITEEGTPEVLPQEIALTGQDKKGTPEVLHAPDVTVPAFDEQRYYLGKLCPQGHDYNGSGLSLRYAPSATKGGCVACDAVKARERRARQKATAQAQEG